MPCPWNVGPQLAKLGAVLAVLLFCALGCSGSSEQSTPESLVRSAARAKAESAESTLRLYAALDTAGAFLCYGCDSAADSVRDMLVCWVPSEDCATDGPAWDVSLVASAYSVGVENIDASQAVGVVRYQLFGRVTGGEVNLVQDSLEWRPTMERSASGWRITGVESQRPPVISKSSAMRLARTPADSARLSSLRP